MQFEKSRRGCDYIEVSVLSRTLVQILKGQLSFQFTIYNNYCVDYREIVPGPYWIRRVAQAPWGPAMRRRYLPNKYKSKVSSIVILYRTLSDELTFENLVATGLTSERYSNDTTTIRRVTLSVLHIYSLCIHIYSLYI